MSLATELYPEVEWAQPLPGLELPPDFLPLTVDMLEAYVSGQAEGYAAPHDPILRERMPEIPEENLASMDTRAIVNGLKQKIEAEQERTDGKVAGLSANQARMRARIAGFALAMRSNTDTERTMTYIANPEIVPIANPETGEFETVDVQNGCVRTCLESFVNVTDFTNALIRGWDVTTDKPTRCEHHTSKACKPT